MKTSISTLSLTLTLALLGGCATSPDYKGPPAFAGDAAARGGFLRAPAGTAATAPAARWWEALGDPVLDRLVETALVGSPDIAIADARITQARAGLAANRTALLPSVNVSSVAPYFNVPGGLFSSNGQSGGRDSVTVYNVGFDASWEVDLFGGTHRKIEGASARAEAAEAGVADARVAISAEIARAYVTLRAKQATIGLMEQRLEIDRDLVAMAEQRLRGGTAPAQPVAQAKATLAQSEAELATTRADASVLLDQIAALAGKEPGALDTELAASPTASVPLPPAEVAIGDPALLLRSRPDIRVAERTLAAADADVGVQIANRFPKLSILGLIGLGGQNIGDIFDPAKIIGLALPQLKWSLFDGGRAKAQVSNARGARAEAEAGYRKAVLGALQDAEGSLTRFGSQRIGYGKALEAEDQARRIAQLQAQRAAGGTLSRAESLSAGRQALAALAQTVAARAQLTSSFIAVEKALGLGWQGAEAPK